MTQQQIQTILENRDPLFIEQLAQKSAQVTRQYFGYTISLYTPLYLSNYCSSGCLYCGFNHHLPIGRTKLTLDQIRSEMTRIAATGIENILLLTGESYEMTPLSYLQSAIGITKEFFSSIALEVYPLEENEYQELYLEGIDGVTVYQETYHQKRYQQLHPSGKKSDYQYRLKTPERAARAGIRHISMGILLGLSDPSEDLCELYQHLRWMEKHFPGIEYSLSFPRLRKVKGVPFIGSPIDDATFIKILCLTRILFPRVGISLSTRENPTLRDQALGLCVTRISAGSNTSVGGYTIVPPEDQAPQFEIEDHRSVQEIVKTLKEKKFDPVLTDWRRIPNEVFYT